MVDICFYYKYLCGLRCSELPGSGDVMAINSGNVADFRATVSDIYFRENRAKNRVAMLHRAWLNFFRQTVLGP